MEPDRKDERWLSLAEAVSRGEVVDWDHVEEQSLNDEENGVVRALRAVEEIARVHKSPAPTMSAAAEKSERSMPDIRHWRHLEILERVGQGTFGAVYRAREQGLDREVALKLIWPRAGDTLIHPSTILNEARLLARVRHPNVVTVYGAESVDGRVGLWMEFIRGRTLEDLLIAQGPLGAREATAIGIDLCHALAAVHGAGLLHRDLKCRNVMRQEGGRIVLMDFGASAELSLSQPGRGDNVAGTPAYLAPELFEGGRPSASTDVYSLGVLIYHLVSGSYPVEGSTKDIRREHALRQRHRLRDSRPDLPDAFVRVVERALAYDPSERYQTAGAFGDELAASLGFSHASPAKSRDPLLDLKWLGKPWLLVAALILLLSGTSVALWWGITSASRERSRQAAAVRETTQSPANPSPAEPASYEIAARFHSLKNGRDQPLRSGDRLTPGDQLFLTVQSSKPTYVYVVNQDEQGESYLMFPLPELGVTNPLPAGTTHRLPGTRNGEEFNWRVTSAGGREHLLIFASPDRLEEFERIVSTLPRPKLDEPVVQLTKQAIGKLRGVGGLAKTSEKPTTGASMGFPFASPLLERTETARGFWAREIVFENPTR